MQPRVELKTLGDGRRAVVVKDTPKWWANPIKWIGWRLETRRLHNRLRKALRQAKAIRSWRAPL